MSADGGEMLDIADLLSSTRDVLLDFDGPICSIFAEFPAPMVAAHLRDFMEAEGATLPAHVYDEDDPLDVFRFAATLGPDVCKQVEDVLRNAELHATRSARPTPHADEFMRTCRRTGRRLAVVSNNSQTAVETYLTERGLTDYIDTIAARIEPDPTLMKPNPHLVLRALNQLRARPTAAVLIGDSTTDVDSARAAGVPCVGYANKPGKRQRLTLAGADALVTTMAELVASLATH